MTDDADPSLPAGPRANEKVGSTAAADLSKLRAIVEECLERYDAEGERVVEEACARHPELEARIRKRIATLRGAGLLAGNAPEADRPPERLGEFRLLTRLGAGGMGVVYLAEQSSLGRTVALKLVRPEHLFFPGARERFQREVESVAKLQHPGIVQVFAVGEAQGVPYFAMEHIRGCSLAGAVTQLAQRQPEELSGRDLLALCCAGASLPMPEEGLTPPVFAGSWVQTCSRIVQQVAQALHHAHGRGILHRDVKPSNVIVAPDGRVVLLDFGLARAEGVSKLTRSGAMLGSLHYAAPEQLRNPLQVDSRTDVYSLGVTFYELLALHAPYDAETGESLQALIQQGEPPPLRARNSAVPWDAETICFAAMDRDPSRRYPSALDFARDLSSFLSFRTIAAKRPSAGLRVKRWTQRHPAKATAIALLLLVALFGPLAFGLQQMAAKRDIGAAQRITSEALELMKARDAASKKNLEHAMAAVNAMLTRFAQETMERSPELDGLRRDVLAEAVSLLVLLDEENPDDDKLQMTLAMTQKRCGDAYRKLGQYADARTAYERSLATFERMHPTYPERALIERQAGGALNSLGAVASELGDGATARAAFERAREWMSRSRTAHPEAPEIASELAAASQNLALVHQASGELETARTLLDEAVEVRRDLIARFPAHPALGLKLRLAIALSNRGRLFRMLRSLSEARRDLEEARDLLEPLRAEEDAAAEASSTLAAVHQALGAVEVVSANPEGSVACYEAAHDVWQALAERYRERPIYRLSLAVAKAELAELLVGDRPRQAELFDASVELAEEVLAKAPSSEAYVKVGQMHVKRGRASLRSDPNSAEADFRRAIELELRWLEERPSDPQRLAQIALAEHHLALAQHGAKRAAEALVSAEAAAARMEPVSTEVARKVLGTAMLSNVMVFPAQVAFETGDRARGVALLKRGYARGAVERSSLEALAERGAITVAELEVALGGG